MACLGISVLAEEPVGTGGGVEKHRRFLFAARETRKSQSRTRTGGKPGRPRAAAATPPAASRQALDFFEAEVRPLLSARCYSCHGPAVQLGGLRLDLRAALLRGGGRGPAVVPGSPARSLLLKAVRHEGLKMPPDGQLAAHEIAALEKWIEIGAPWPAGSTGPPAGSKSPRGHWAFRPLARAAVPSVKDRSWLKTPVDAFVLEGLERKGLRPAPPADRRTLIRRATLDLIGLPPSPEEVTAFVNDRSPDAWEKVVDRLLASPHYGERWGRHWLDVVRYADTAGETADYPVPEAYRYRNYVIRAFNRDTPYDRFITEQIAGDILAREGAARGAISAERYAELVTATGFLALSRRFGYDTERYEHLTIQDTIDTTGQTVLGLSLGCARCHDHKFDPVSMRDYYGLYGIFASTRYAFAGSERLQQVRAMVPLVPPAEAAARWKEWHARLNLVQEDLKAAKRRLNQGWRPVTLRPLSGLDGDFELQAPPQGGSLGRPANPWLSSEGVLIELGAQSPFTHAAPPGANGVAFASGQEESSLGRGLVPAFSARSHDRVHFGLDFHTAAIPAGSNGSYRVYVGSRAGNSPAVELFITAEGLFARGGEAVAKLCAINRNGARWYHLQLTLDLRGRTFSGSIGAPGDVTSISSRPLAAAWDGCLDYLLIDGKGHLSGTRPAIHVDNILFSEEPLPPLPAAGAAGTTTETSPSAANQEELTQRVTALEQKLAELLAEEAFPQAYAAWEGTPHDARIQKRGEPDQPGEVAPRGFLQLLGGDRLPPGTEGSGRLELARWLMRPQNPLPARVMVNRIWQHHFGRGLVPTENDFGTRGRRPTHPELLDFLASVFRTPAGTGWERGKAGEWVQRKASARPPVLSPSRWNGAGWSVKRLHRLILLSSVYQMAGTGDPRAATLDPNGELLARFPRRRLEAEAIRDSMVALGEGLALQTPPGEGGRHPFPALQKTVFTQHAPFNAVYETDRRSVYLMTQRIRRHPFLALFDGPDTNASTARRTTTTVPTQALYLMNNPFVHEQSIGFGRRLQALSARDEERVMRGYELALARLPSQQELREALEFIRRYRELAAAAGVPEAEREAHVWGGFARTLFARNEFLFIG